MTRRAACTGLGAAALGFIAGPGAAEPEVWGVWKDAFLDDSGRVLDDTQGVSHSEGQGYGLLLAQAHGDRTAFEAIEAWTRVHLVVRGDALMAWRWRPGAGTPDLQTATDGDLLRAWALLRAARDSGWEGHEAKALANARDLATHCLVPDPRAPDEPLLSPFADPEGGGSAVLVNPSYYHTRAMRELGAAAGVPELVRAADHGETLLAEVAAKSWLPDWLVVTGQGPAMAEGYSPAMGYDALRIPLYLAWSGRADHPAVAAARMLKARVNDALPDGHVPTVISREGRLVAASDYPGYRALWALVEAPARETRALGLVAPQGQPYYPATLGLLAEVAAREGGPWG
ncbi:glycosyl hydrolase family 8 [Histidinibacterium aquaticum]|uniref:cellulase n=1 Tax=Histidinibacterium aquaticum TaxID=2613962 RepID=A0A5J5GLK9_9RHOB|nr:glycosyl hydrolase family 8 [Histidinibacterium aquaticum]KAA9008362.1 glycosyl hydrolase family 5 [Histidinibacterium aquaticum]